VQHENYYWYDGKEYKKSSPFDVKTKHKLSQKHVSKIKRDHTVVTLNIKALVYSRDVVFSITKPIALSSYTCLSVIHSPLL